VQLHAIIAMMEVMLLHMDRNHANQLMQDGTLMTPFPNISAQLEHILPAVLCNVPLALQDITQKQKARKHAFLLI